MDLSMLDPDTEEAQLRAEGLWELNDDMTRGATRTRKKTGRPRGYTVTAETRSAISKAKLGKPLSKEHRAALSRAATKRWASQAARNAQRMRLFEYAYDKHDPDLVVNRWEADEKRDAERRAAVEARRAAAVRAVIDEVDSTGIGRLVDGSADDISPDDVLRVSRVMLSVLMGREIPSSAQLDARRATPTAPDAPGLKSERSGSESDDSAPAQAPTLLRRVLARCAAPGYRLPGSERRLLGHALIHDQSLNDADRALIRRVLEP